jgi:exopolysaccharide biosynthesis protein
MNLDGGSSTQMVYRGQLVNTPTIAGGGRVTNALLVIPGEVEP